ncbi:MAG TPA: hypothetical protein VFE50_10825 [Cyclobacteriaceae bacterium]|nr:hypothetical protein [Cyclobacteriaceae bacterium]
MKRAINAIALIVLGLLLISCRKDVLDELTHFSFETDYLVKVPASPIASIPVDIVTPEIATHSDVLFDANNTRADKVEKISLTVLDLTVKTPEGGNLRFLKSVAIYAKAEGLPEVKVAYKDNVPEDIGGRLDLDVTGVELKQYFTKEKYTLRISVTTDQVISQDYGINAHGVFMVDAKIFGE